jgi:hypothetical protein
LQARPARVLPRRAVPSVIAQEGCLFPSRKEIAVNADDYLTNTDHTIARTDYFGDLEKARLTVAEAQVFATAAIAAAVDRLAEAVENLQN